MERGHVENLTKQHLFLSKAQNSAATRGMETEGLFGKFMHDPAYTGIFNHK